MDEGSLHQFNSSLGVDKQQKEVVSLVDNWEMYIEQSLKIEEKDGRSIENYTYEIPGIAFASFCIGSAKDLYPKNVEPTDPTMFVCELSLLEVKNNNLKKGLGIGKSFMRKIIQKAKEKGCVEIRCNATMLKNHRYDSKFDHPYYFYLRLGFKPGFDHPVNDVESEVQKQIQDKNGDVPMVLGLNNII